MDGPNNFFNSEICSMFGSSHGGAKGTIQFWFEKRVDVSFVHLRWKFESLSFRGVGIITVIIQGSDKYKNE